MTDSKLVVNLDVLFMNDLVMSLVLLWATAKFARLCIRIWPFIFSGILGALYTIILVFPFFKNLSGSMYILVHLLLNLVTAVLMIWTAFGTLKPMKFLKTLGYFYLITFVAGGAALSIYFILGSSPTNWIFGLIKIGDTYSWLYLIAVMVALIIGRYGWNLIKERFHRGKYHLKFQIWVGDQSVQVTGLLDTGNKLKDPLTRLPVIVVEKSAVLDLFPPEIQKILLEDELDVIDMAEKLFQTGWYNRFQIIPFSSLGNKSDLLIGLKVDGLEILGNNGHLVERVIVALHQEELDLEGDYHALLHPDVFEVF